MIRLLAAWTRIAVVAVSMAMSIPAITFAQTPESATESEPTAEDNTSVETNPPARSTSPSEVEAENQRLINELRSELLDDRAIRLKPDLGGAYINRGNAKQKLGQYEAAIADYDEAIRLNPALVEAYSNRGVAKAGLDLKDEARKDFEIALELARKANDAKIVAQAEQLLRDLDAAEGS